MKSSISFVFMVLMACIAMVSACTNACAGVSERDGRCYYSCIENSCNLSGSHHQGQFLGALSDRGYDCRPEGATSLSCTKTPDFGGCFTHKWTCGFGC
ncbi:uncharacterized protein BX664DRAFT_372541 [Halteromyces radiatus]|uniref:uncharacterized protein n=1 Tax=Halteromyces radiatus TaxID=101107 RepID=UPI00221F0EF5|nr:uncharacterized protein BX664DRAFT_372541 [Halteromyces radiatus]KAI8093697.1 hypothetical protein BX664DRAFT_372541 [Halteromyces radiatus]